MDQSEYPLNMELHVIDDGDEISLPNGYVVRVFKTIHRVESFGFALFHQRAAVWCTFLITCNLHCIRSILLQWMSFDALFTFYS